MTAPAGASPAAAGAPVEVDHLVVAAATLDQGVAWCESTLGAVPGPGGRHALFGTHNRLLRIDSEAFPAAYLEIIAIDPDAPRPARPRWFGLDDSALKASLAAAGPRLLHVVVRAAQLDARLAALASAGVDAGIAIAASREKPQGQLRWRIAVRPDGALLHGGALPTLIEWAGVHPTRAMPPTPVRLAGLVLRGVPAAAVAALDLQRVRFAPLPGVAESGAADPSSQGPGALSATFDTPRGRVTLESP
ncbi:MAG: VOC family protein [Rubrivivax sp.]|nr:VOC family protein [Rubrivivax sp.]